MSENWIQKAVPPSHRGLLRKAAHAKPGKKIPVKKLSKFLHSKDVTTRRRAQFAKNMRALAAKRKRG